MEEMECPKHSTVEQDLDTVEERIEKRLEISMYEYYSTQDKINNSS